MTQVLDIDSKKAEALAKQYEELAAKERSNIGDDEWKKIEKNASKCGKVMFSILLGAAAVRYGKKTIELVTSVTLAGIAKVTDVICYGQKFSFDLLRTLFDKICNYEALKNCCVEPNNLNLGVKNALKLGTYSVFTMGGIFVLMGMLETINALRKYVFHVLCWDDGRYTWSKMWSDITKIWKGNLIAAGTGMIASTIVVGAIVVFNIQLLWQQLILQAAAGFLSCIMKWKYYETTFDVSDKKQNERQKIYSRFQQYDSKKNEGRKKKLPNFPEQLYTLVWMFESMNCLSFVLNKDLSGEKIDKQYEDITGKAKLPDLEKFKTQGKWELRRAVLYRYVQDIQKSDTEVERAIIEACQERQNEKKRMHSNVKAICLLI